MAATQIGSGAVVLTTQADSLVRGLADSQTRVDKWARNVEATAGRAFGGSSFGRGLADRIGGSLARADGIKAGLARQLDGAAGSFGQAFGQIGGGLKFGTVTAGAAGLAVAIGGAVKGLETMDRMAAVGRTAQAFGMTTEAATGLFGVMGAAGSDVRDATEGLVTLGQRVTDAMSGSGEQAKKLFDGLGVSAEAFAGLDPSEQFYKLHDALRQVKDPAERVQLLLQAVGEDTGKNLISTLSMSTEGLRKQAAGFSVTAGEMANVIQANQSVAQATAKMQKAWESIVVALAPVAEYVGDIIPPAVDALQAKFAGFGEFVVPALNGVAVGAGDIFGAIKAGVGAVGVAAAAITDAFGNILGAVREPLTAVVTFMADKVADLVAKLREVGTTLAGVLPENLKPARVDNFNNGLGVLEQKLRGTGDSFGKGLEVIEGRAKNGAANVGGIGQQWIDEWGQTGDKIDAAFEKWAADREKKLKTTTESLKPGEVAKRTYNAAAGLDADGKAGDKANPPKLAGAMVQGSREAYSAIAQGQLFNTAKVSVPDPPNVAPVADPRAAKAQYAPPVANNAVNTSPGSGGGGDRDMLQKQTRAS